MNAFLSFPGILLAIAFVAFRGPGIFNLVLALSLGGWVGYARLVRAQVLAAREREYVEAARALGASDLRVITRHILPNIIQPVVVQSAIGMAGAILAEATMSFLGLGVPPPTASWGAMLNDGRSHLFDSPHLVLFPALAVMLAVLSFNFIGDALRDVLDPAPVSKPACKPHNSRRDSRLGVRRAMLGKFAKAPSGSCYPLKALPRKAFRLCTNSHPLPRNISGHSVF